MLPNENDSVKNQSQDLDIFDDTGMDKKLGFSYKRWNFGYSLRNTLELFHEGWLDASRDIQKKKRNDALLTRHENYQTELETSVYYSSFSADLNTKLQILKYFQQAKEAENIRKQRKDLVPYTWGEQIMSVVSSLSVVVIMASITGFGLSYVCGNSQTKFCNNVRSNFGSITDYFTEPDTKPELKLKASASANNIK